MNCPVVGKRMFVLPREAVNINSISCVAIYYYQYSYGYFFGQLVVAKRVSKEELRGECSNLDQQTQGGAREDVFWCW